MNIQRFFEGIQSYKSGKTNSKIKKEKEAEASIVKQFKQR
jgi:hypothetical protein